MSQASPVAARSLSAICLLRSFSIVFAQVAALASLACALSVMLTLPTTEPQSTDFCGVAATSRLINFSPACPGAPAAAGAIRLKPDGRGVAVHDRRGTVWQSATVEPKPLSGLAAG